MSAWGASFFPKAGVGGDTPDPWLEKGVQLGRSRIRTIAVTTATATGNLSTRQMERDRAERQSMQWGRGFPTYQAPFSIPAGLPICHSAFPRGCSGDGRLCSEGADRAPDPFQPVLRETFGGR